jgi:peptide/nickel transport system ATP-binding protein/oligopeptide transport system ATP-binding protein
MAAAALLLEARQLETEFTTFEGTTRPVNAVDLAIHEGEIVGLVGETGAGKTVLARSLVNRVTAPGRIVGGRVLYRGTDLLRLAEVGLRAIRGREIAWIGSNPRGSLDPVQTVGRQLVDVVRAHSRRPYADAWARGVDLLRSVQIPDPVRRMAAYPHELSGGMAQRVVVAMALAHDPRLLIADEPTFGLDVTIQVQILDLIRDAARSTGAAALLVTQDLAVVAHYCDTVMVMYAGEIVEQAPVSRFFASAIHPYSLALLRSAFAARGEERGMTMRGVPPRLLSLPSGCKFHPRCPVAQEQCRMASPTLEVASADHHVRCLRKDELV